MNQRFKNLSASQASAIKVSVKLGRRLIFTNPEIKELYRGGKTLLEIAEELDIRHRFKVSNTTAWQAVGYSLRGFGGFDKMRGYEGLYERSKLEPISRSHMKSGGEKARDLGLGIHGLSKAERIANSKGGRFTRFTKDGKRAVENGKRGGIKTTLLRGQIPWAKRGEAAHTPLSEIEYALALSLSPDYQHKIVRKGAKIGEPDRSLITEEINKIFHNGYPVRNKNSLSSAMSKYRKRFSS